MIADTNWDLPTSGHGKDYSNLNNGTDLNYPGRTTDGKASAKVGLPNWGEMHTGNDLNITHWFRLPMWPMSTLTGMRTAIMQATTGWLFAQLFV